jgi:hypothetical protein
MAMSIQYHDLSRDRSEIRLLQLLPNLEPQYARIPCCRLSQTSLRDAPSYKALSYAWGNADKTRVILVNDIGIRIPENLFDALIALRPSGYPFYMWVDYLCINQRDDREKTWLVAMMGEIYKQADQVLAWLGPGDPESQKGIKFLNELGEKAYMCGFYHNHRIGHGIWPELASLYSTLPGGFPFDSIPRRLILQVPGLYQFMKLGHLFREINGMHDKEKCVPIREINNIFGRPWFGRVWVLQEIALSQKAIFICGTMEISREKLAAAMNAYQCLHMAISGMLKDERIGLSMYHYQVFCSGFFRAVTMANAHRIKMTGFPLIALLRLTCVGSPNLKKHGPHHLNSSDPRDKIFALLGLASDQKALSEKGVIPDYTKSTREVYIFTTSVLLQQGHISLLSLIQPHKPSAHGNLPSWVPDWYQPLTEPLQIVHDDHMTLEPEFGASGPICSTPSVRVDIKASNIHGISLKGYVCDRIHSVGSFPNRLSSWDVPPERQESWPGEWLVEILRLTYQTKSNFASFRDRLHAVARASVGGGETRLTVEPSQGWRGNIVRGYISPSIQHSSD